MSGETGIELFIDGLSFPTSLTFDQDSNLYVAEYFANLVLKLSSNGTVLWTARGA